MKRFKIFMSGVCLVSVMGTAFCGCGKKSDDTSGKTTKKKDTEVTESIDDVTSTDDTLATWDVPDMNTDTNGGAMTIGTGMPSGNPLMTGQPTEEPASPTIDIDTYDWESIYEWEGTEITGFVDPLPEEVMNTGVLVVPEKCVTIKPQAFKESMWLKEVKFQNPEKIEIVGDGAFARCPQLHSFVVPPHANPYQEGKITQSNNWLFSSSRTHETDTRIYNIVLPDCQVFSAFVTNIANGDTSDPVNNQTYLRTVYCPKNFSIRYSGVDFVDFDYTPQMFAKYSKEYKEKNFPDALDVSINYYEVPCTVYVVKDSWADTHFDEWTMGDLIQKEYWDGEHYTFVDYEPTWDINYISFSSTGSRTTIHSAHGDWKITTRENNEITFESFISPEDFSALYAEILSLKEEGKLRDGSGTDTIRIKGFIEDFDASMRDEEEGTFQALLEKYKK